MKGAGTNDTCLIEILASRTNAELQQIKQARCVSPRSGFAWLTLEQIYQAEHRKSLEASIASETSGDYKVYDDHLSPHTHTHTTLTFASQEFLLRLCNGRDESTAVIDNNARQDAERLYRAGEGTLRDLSTHTHRRVRPPGS
jgi:hypothetical protein